MTEPQARPASSRARAPRVKAVPLRVSRPGLVPTEALDSVVARTPGSAATKKATAKKATAPAGAAASPVAPPKRAVAKKAAPASVGAPSSPAVDGAPAAGSDGARTPDVFDERVAGALAFLRRRLTGRYEVDEFGFDPELAEAVWYPTLNVLYEQYFRVECFGAQNLPAGAALLVANHSGTLPIDALMLANAVHEQTQGRRHLRLLGADLVFKLPFISEVARKVGSTLACNPDATRLMDNGEYVGVFPEGFKGLGKPYRDRYRLQRFGRGGFVAAALRTGTPIVPVSIVGAEEIYPIIANLTPVARVTGLPYFPVTPLFPMFGLLGLLPLPSKWLIEFGTPIETASYHEDPDDPIVVFNLADQVRESIQQTLHTLLERRPDAFS